jgi:hypothetical protein
MRRAVLWLSSIAAALLIVASLLLWHAGALSLKVTGAGPAGDPVPIQTADLSGSGPGTLLSATTMPSLSRTNYGRLFEAARVLYRSTSGDSGRETLVSGSVFTPVSPAPEGGWPVVALGHGTTGVDELCAPSGSASLLGLVEGVVGYVKLGYAVALTDYQGLGSPGVHPYTDSRTAGLNMIDSVRALRHTFSDVSDRWAAVGGSQGGGAAWAANELAATYAPELDLVGALAYVPVTNVSGLVDNAMAGRLTTDQATLYEMVVESLTRLHNDINHDDFRRGAAAKYWDALTACSGSKVSDRLAAAQELQPGDLGPSSRAAADRLRGLLEGWAIPQQRLSAPLSVVYGGKGSFIDAQWTTDAISRACTLGGTVAWDLQPDKAHGDVDIEPQLAWLADRFAGKAATNECPT